MATQKDFFTGLGEQSNATVKAGVGLANQVQLAGGAASAPISITALGSDTNITINLIPKGTGTAKVNGQQIVVGAVSDTPPAAPYENQVWTDGTSGLTYTYVNDGTSLQWVELGPSGTATGSSGGLGATGAGGDAVFYENDKTVTTSYTITSTRNAGSFGPITILSGVTVTVPDNCVWSIV